MQALSRTSQLTELAGPPPAAGPRQQEQAKQLATVRDTSLRCLLAVVHCLDAWSAPMKEGGEQQQGAQGQQEDSDSAGESGRANGAPGVGSNSASEAERFESAKVTKSSLNRGFALFNGGSPVKAMRLLRSRYAL